MYSTFSHFSCGFYFLHRFKFLCFLCILCIPPSLLPIIVAHLPLLHLILHQHREDLSLDRLQQHYRNYHNLCSWKRLFLFEAKKRKVHLLLQKLSRPVFFTIRILEIITTRILFLRNFWKRFEAKKRKVLPYLLECKAWLKSPPRQLDFWHWYKCSIAKKQLDPKTSSSKFSNKEKNPVIIVRLHIYRLFLAEINHFTW